MVVLSFVKYGNIHNAINLTFSIPCDAYLHIFYGLLHTFSSGPLRFCQQKHFSSSDLCITDTAVKVSRSLYCFTASISHGVEKYFPGLWGTAISDVNFLFLCQLTCQSADIMASFCGVRVCVRVRVTNFFSKTTRPRDMLFFLKDTLTIEDDKS